MKTVVLLLIVGLVALASVLPVSGVENYSMHDGSGNQIGHHSNQNGNCQHVMSGSGTCICKNCPDNRASIQNGTGMRCSMSF